MQWSLEDGVSEYPSTAGPALRPLEELLAMRSWYDILGVSVAASRQAIKKAYTSLALVYHPDKGGDTQVFQFISHVYQVLYDNRTRAKYDREGRAPFVDGWEAPPPRGTSQAAHTKVAAPKTNADFMRDLSNRVGSGAWSWGSALLRDVLVNVATQNRPTHDSYRECQLAVDAGVPLRLVGETANGWKGMPVYGMPRLVRFPALAEMGYMELDFPASHGRQILKYARKQNLPRDVLEEAFASRESIDSFRRSFAGVAPGRIKSITNMLAYGNGGKEWCDAEGLSELPGRLKALKEQIKGVASHNFSNCPEKWKAVSIAKKKFDDDKGKPERTCLSILCQAGERADLDKCVSCLPTGVAVFGYLGDSVLVKEFDAAPYQKHMSSMEIIIEKKALPQNLGEYAEAFYEIVKMPFDRSSPFSIKRVSVYVL
jgi:curved DNA-binding protein CbpA